MGEGTPHNGKERKALNKKVTQRQSNIGALRGTSVRGRPPSNKKRLKVKPTKQSNGYNNNGKGT